MARANATAIPWRLLIKVGKPFWVSEKKWTAYGHLAAILVLMFANSYLGKFLVETSGQFMTAVEQHDFARMQHLLIYWVAAILIAVPLVQTFYTVLKTRLALVWRSWMSTTVLFRAYHSNFAWYKLLKQTDIDNPDQRMTADLDAFCNTSVNLTISLLDAVTTMAVYGYLLWTLAPVFSLQMFGLTAASSLLVLLICKLFLPLLVAVCAAIGNVAVLWIGRTLPDINFAIAESEATLRFKLAETRREAETIAFAHGEKIAELQADKGMTRVMDALFRMMGMLRNQGLFTNPYGQLVPLVPMALMGYLCAQGLVPVGTVVAAGGAFMAVYGGATVIMNNFWTIMGYANSINRVGSLMTALDATAEATPTDGKHIDVIEGDAIRFQDLTVSTPDGDQDLIVGLNLEIKRGGRILVTGNHGVGKTALLRATAGFWTRGKGHLQRLPYGKMMFLTASPYFPAMTLREALCYPLLETCKDDERLKQALQGAKLADLPTRAGGLDGEQSWRDMLTASEQQRLSLARVILQKPEAVFVDQATNALEDDLELFFYTLLLSLNCTVVSAGAASLSTYHEAILEIGDDGRCTLHPAGR